MLPALPQAGYSYQLPRDLSITAVYFNHDTSGTTNDAITINSGYSTTITAPEWTKTDSTRFAYIKSTQANIKATLYRESTGSDINYADINVFRNSGTSIGTFPDYTRFTFSGSSVTQQINRYSGSAPTTVGKYNVGLRWVVVGINGNPATAIIGNTSHIYYTVVDAPKAPFDGSVYSNGTPVIYNQTGPWVAVLDSACAWAKNCTTASAADSCIADSLYWSKDTSSGRRELFYFFDVGEPTRHFYSAIDEGANVDSFALQRYISDITNQNNNDENYVDCLDMANIMQLYCSSIGCSINRWTIIKSSSGNFFTNYINPIGWTLWDDFEWTCHFVTETTNVYDASLRLNQSSPILPKNYDWNDYFDDFTENAVEKYDDNLVHS